MCHVYKNGCFVGAFMDGICMQPMWQYISGGRPFENASKFHSCGFYFVSSVIPSKYSYFMPISLCVECGPEVSLCIAGIFCAGYLFKAFQTLEKKV